MTDVQINTPISNENSDIVPHQRTATILLAVLAVLALWAKAVLWFGLPALVLPAVASVPVIFLTLIWITWG